MHREKRRERLDNKEKKRGRQNSELNEREEKERENARVEDAIVGRTISNNDYSRE